METKAIRFTLPLAHDARSVKAARTAINEHLVASSGTQFISDAVLLTSELVTNALTHTLDGCQLQFYFDPVARFLRVDVHDSSSVQPAIVNRAAGAGGLGLRLVDGSSTAWGSAPTPTGKSVWFELGNRPEHP